MTDDSEQMTTVTMNLSPEGPVGVIQAISRVMAQMPGIPKDATFSGSQGYNYRSIEALTVALQPLLAEHGVVIVPSAHVTATVPSPAMKEGWSDTFMEVEWTVYGPDGSSIQAATNGIGRDNSDKGANKAQTQAFKYLLLHLLCIADARDDVDQHGDYEDQRAEPEAPVELAPIEDRRAINERMRALPANVKDDFNRQWNTARLPKPSDLTVRSIVRAQGLLRGFEAKARTQSGNGATGPAEAASESPVADSGHPQEPDASSTQPESQEPPQAGTESEGQDSEPDDDHVEERKRIAAEVQEALVDIDTATVAKVTADVKKMGWRVVDKQLRERFGEDITGLHVDSRRMLLTAHLAMMAEGQA